MHRILRQKYSTLNSADFEPHSVIKVLKRSNEPNKEPVKLKKNVVNAEKVQKIEKTDNVKTPPNITATNRNEMGIQMISRSIFNQIFKQNKNDPADSKKVER